MSLRDIRQGLKSLPHLHSASQWLMVCLRKWHPRKLDNIDRQIATTARFINIHTEDAKRGLAEVPFLLYGEM